MSFKTKELNEACKSLNTVLEKDERIKYVGVKSSEVVEEFQKKVEERNESGKNIPDDVVDFYNAHFAEEETAKEETPMKAEKETKKEKKEKTKDKKEKKEKKVKEDKKEKKEKKAKTDKTEKKERKERKTRGRQETPSDNTREKSVVDALKKGGKFNDLIQKSDDIYVKNGGKTNTSQAKRILERGIKYLFYAGVLEVNDGKYKLNV